MTDLIKGWARVGAWMAVGAGAVAALLGASALSMLAAMAQRVAGKAMTREEMDREIERAILGRKRQPWQVDTVSSMVKLAGVGYRLVLDEEVAYAGRPSRHLWIGESELRKEGADVETE